MYISATEKDDNKYKVSHFDMSVECKLDGVNSKIYIIFEHKSYQDRMTIMQIIKYCMLIWEDELKANKKSLRQLSHLYFIMAKMNQNCIVTLEIILIYQMILKSIY